MGKGVVGCLECPWFGACLATTVLTVISVCCPPIQNGMSMKKKSTLYPNIPSAILPVPHGDGLPVTQPPDNFALYSDDKDSVSSNSEEQQPSASRDADYLQAQTPPVIRSQKVSSMTSSEISNFQKIRQIFWHQGYNSRIYYTTP